MHKLHVKDIIFLTLIAIIFSLIYLGTDFIYDGLTIALTPVKLGPLANDLMLGIWCMAGPLAALIIRKPGAGFLAEFLGAAIELAIGGQWGIANLISGLTQGLGVELGFALCRYRRYDWLALISTTTTTALVTFAYDLVKNGYSHFAPTIILLYFCVRWLSLFIFSGVLVKLIANLLAKSLQIKL